MEQKAVTYKTIKGMARDMAMSSGSNDFSYENYNIRITTRGKEDSLIVTNEKGTESNIIATRSVTKTVNNIFVGKKPDFYQSMASIIASDRFNYSYTELYKAVGEVNDPASESDYGKFVLINEEEYVTGKDKEGNDIKFYRQDITKTESVLSTSTDDITFGVNTEYPVAGTNELNEVVVKGILKIEEQPTTYMGEEYYLLDNHEFEKEVNIVIPKDSNNSLRRISIKDIVLNKDNNLIISGSPAGYYKKKIDIDDTYTIVSGSRVYTNDNYPSLTESIQSYWMDSYKELYNKLIERRFNFYGFDAAFNNYTASPSLGFLKIEQDKINNDLSFIEGRLQAGEYYLGNILEEKNTDSSGDDSGSTDNGYYRVYTDVNSLGFLNGYVFADKYPTGTKLTLTNKKCYIKIPLFRTLSQTDFTEQRTTINAYRIDNYSAFINDVTTAVTSSESASELNNYVIKNGYLKFEFDIDLASCFVLNKSISKTQTSCKLCFDTTVAYHDVSDSYFNGSNETTITGINCNLYFSNYSKSTSAMSITITGDVKKSEEFPYLSFLNFSGSSSYNSARFVNYGGPFFNYNIDEVNSESSSNYIPSIKLGSYIKEYILSGSEELVKTFTTNIFFIDSTSVTADDSTTVSTSDGFNFAISNKSGNYLCKKYEILTTDTDNINISSISSNGTNEIKILLSDDNDTELTYNTNTFTISDLTNAYHIIKAESSEYTSPFIFYVRTMPIETGFSNGVKVYLFDDCEFTEVTGSALSIINNDVNDKSSIYSGSTSLYLFYDDNNNLKIGTSVSNTINGNTVVTKYNSLPIFYNGNNSTTLVQSTFDQVYNNPTYDVVVSKYGFKQDKFNITFKQYDVKSFRLKYSNSNWDEKYIYQMLDNEQESDDYIKDDVYPYYYLDTTKLDLVVEKTDNNVISLFKIQANCNENVFFDPSSSYDIYITMKDKKSKTFFYKNTLANFIEGISVNSLGLSSLSSDLLDRHDFYIAEINSYENEPQGFEKDNIDQDIINNFDNDNDREFYDGKIEYESWSYTDGNEIKHLFVKQIYTPSDGYKQTATIEYDFKNSYKNKFYSSLGFSVLVSNYGEYSALTIPGRILGSCTIDEYVVLFFHYSSPALKYYQKIGDNEYRYVLPNTSGINDLYTKRLNENKYDLAVKNNILLRDDNNDYINGKNKDYIIKLKYINAKPDNKENEWVTIVNKIANAATQVELETPIVEKKPYYSAEILWSGNLKFNANNGIETIGYYESKDVIKVYWTDGKNQPRMINIMTPKSKRGNGDMSYTWDNKTFDFIQEISGDERYEITKQFGGGAFPAGSVQYYFTYSNLGGCETNPFACSPIYYTSQPDKGNSPVKITDNTFKIKLTNLSTRFDYVNIYSVVRSSKDMQPICKRIINLSMKNNKKTLTFTDNNLLGEIIDSTYLLMLQGTPISALTMSEKDNTLFLGNINKLSSSMTPEEKEELKQCFVLNQNVRLYQNYNPNEEDWYENIVEKNKISLEKNSSEIKTFVYNEYYRLGIQFQDKFGKWNDPIFIEDVQCTTPIKNRIKYDVSQEDGAKDVTSLQSYIPFFGLKLKKGMNETFMQIVNKFEYKRIRPIIVYPNISSRNVLCQGLLSPTMFNYADRSVNGPFNFSSYYFRPYPPAISENKTESGDYTFDVDTDVAKVGGYPIEYRHGYPITGYHDAIEESLAEGNTITGENNVSKLVSDYLSKKPTTFVKLTSNTPGWNIIGSLYLRQGTIKLNSYSNGYVIGSYEGDIYQVSSDTNKGHINKVGNGSNTYSSLLYLSSKKFRDAATTIYNNEELSSITSKCTFGFSSHMHYFKNSLLAAGSVFTGGAIVDAIAGYPDGEIVKKIGYTDCGCDTEGLLFNEQGVYYKAYYPVTIKLIPLSKIRKEKHRGLKRKTYYCDIIITASRIEMSSSLDGSKYIDDGGFESDVAKKAYFAYNNGEIACANGNKNYNIYKGSVIEKIDDTYGSSELNISSRKQSLFYVDESVCTLNSPEIEYNPTVQKIDLSTYKLNIVGAANITGYKNNIVIDTETPPSAFGTIVGQGFKHEPFEIQNFNTEAYRYMLSGAYWYDSYFKEGDDEEGEKPCEDPSFLSDQYCWWVYPFNRQILNNSKEGQYGKLRTKKWINYHYSAFSDFFGNSSSLYELKDAQQIYDVHQSVNIDTIWQKDKCTYFGSCDTAYINPVPLVGILGGSNEPEENSYEQSLAVSPYCAFKSNGDTYSSANLADIIPFSFNASNHFVLSLKEYDERKASVFPKYYTNENILQDVRRHTTTIPFEYKYELSVDDIVYSTSENVQVFFTTKNNGVLYMYDEGQEHSVKFQKSYTPNLESASIEENFTCMLKTSSSSYFLNDGFDEEGFINISNDSSEIEKENNIITSITFRKANVPKQEYEEYYNDFVDYDNYKTLEKEYMIPSSLILDSTKPISCVEKYIQFNDVEKSNNVKETGIYDYGHVYIAQLERGVKNADDVFSGTEESVLLQNVWIPAGKPITISDINYGIELQYTEGDAYYQRYDCMKTYAHNSQDVNQNIEVLSAMIQTRINLDGIYSYRGTVDNIDMNNSNTNLLNDAYSQSDNYFTYSITNSYISAITEYSNMFTWTLTKQPMSTTDNWMAVNLIAYYNATGSFGKITRIINYRNNLFCFQDNAISQIAYNERVALTPSDGVPIEIGNSGKVQGLNYISSNVGCQNRWSVCPSKGYLYWVDDRRAEIYRFSDSLEPFSTINGFSDWVKANTYGEDWKPIKSTNVPITTYYDNNNDDIYFVTEKDCLAYNEKLNAFESFFSYEDSFILNSAGNTIVIKEQDAVIKENSDIYSGDAWWNNGIRGDGLSSIELMHEGDYNRFFGVQMPFYMRFKVYPSDLQRDKIFTNLEFNLDAFDEKDLYLPDETITKVRIWNEYQWGQWKIGDPLYSTTAYKKRFRTHYLQLPRASYYPTDYYENFNTMFYREPMWKVWNNNVFNTNNVLSYINASSVNDRIRNPWTWLEIYKSNGTDSNDFKEFEIEGSSFKDRQQYYFNNKNKLFIQKYVQISKDEWGNYQELYKIVNNEYVKETNDGSDRQPSVIAVGLEVGYLEIDVTEETFKKLKDSLYIKVEDVYTQEGITDFDENETYYLKEDVMSNYNLSELYYQKQDGTYDNASQDMYDNEDIVLYKLSFNELYALNYINCANIFKFADDVTYYELKKSNCRVEIHDIILKYFEA